MWRETLSHYAIDDIELAISGFIATADQDKARRLVLGDIVYILAGMVEKRVKDANGNRALREIRQHEKDIADGKCKPVRFQQMLAEIQAKKRIP